MTSSGSAFAARRMYAPVRAGWQFRLLLTAAVLGTIAIVVPVKLTTEGRIAAQAPPASAIGASAHGLASLQRLPLQAQGEISTTIATGASAFAARRTESGYAFTGGGVSATVGRRGVSFSTSGGTLSLALAGVGRDGRDHRVGSAAPVARANRVSLHRPGVLEWYAAGPLGVEQGFTVARRPAGSHGPLTLSLRAGGSLRARQSGAELVFETTSATVVLRYGGLSAVDASGRSLPASIALQGGKVLLRIADRGARYPVRVDPFVEQHKIVPTDETGGASGFGGAAGPSEDGVALSSNGSTALIGGPDDGSDGSDVGAAWIFTRSGSTWSEQQKIVPTDEIQGDTPVLFGGAVALSADGSTALIGGNGDSDLNGAAWVYTRTGNTWSEQQKLAGAGDLGVLSDFGWSVALSPSGSTALIGGYNADAAWIFTRSGSGWTQQQAINPSDSTLTSGFGWSVALSTDGSTALIGGLTDNSNTGAVWVYTSSGGNFSEQHKIVPTGATAFGAAVAVSSNGNTALIGSSNADAAWVYTRASGSWSEQQKIVPTDAVGGASSFGNNVALSPDGNLALIGGFDDNSAAGAGWIYGRSGSTWSEQQKIVPSDESAGDTSNFGTDVALSSDESTALIAGPSDNGAVGAAWAYLRSSSPPPPPGSKLSCTLKVGSDKVAVPKQHGRHPKPAAGTLTLKATCNAAASITLKGTVTEVIKPKHGKKHTKTVGLPTEHASLTAGKAKAITVKVSAALVSAVRKGAKDSVKFELTASDSKGTAKASAEIAKLKT